MIETKTIKKLFEEINWLDSYEASENLTKKEIDVELLKRNSKMLNYIIDNTELKENNFEIDEKLFYMFSKDLNLYIHLHENNIELERYDEKETFYEYNNQNFTIDEIVNFFNNINIEGLKKDLESLDMFEEFKNFSNLEDL